MQVCLSACIKRCVALSYGAIVWPVLNPSLLFGDPPPRTPTNSLEGYELHTSLFHATPLSSATATATSSALNITDKLWSPSILTAEGTTISAPLQGSRASLPTQEPQ
jgi:hypothetical protein